MRNMEALYTGIFSIGDETFLQKIMNSAYDTITREDILKAGVRKFYRDWKEAVKEGQSHYRSRSETECTKDVKVITAKSWLKPRRGDRR